MYIRGLMRVGEEGLPGSNLQHRVFFRTGWG